MQLFLLQACLSAVSTSPVHSMYIQCCYDNQQYDCLVSDNLLMFDPAHVWQLLSAIVTGCHLLQVFSTLSVGLMVDKEYFYLRRCCSLL